MDLLTNIKNLCTDIERLSNNKIQFTYKNLKEDGSMFLTTFVNGEQVSKRWDYYEGIIKYLHGMKRGIQMIQEVKEA